jgi:hypothetical protein
LRNPVGNRAQGEGDEYRPGLALYRVQAENVVADVIVVELADVRGGVAAAATASWKPIASPITPVIGGPASCRHGGIDARSAARMESESARQLAVELRCPSGDGRSA